MASMNKEFIKKVIEAETVNENGLVLTPCSSEEKKKLLKMFKAGEPLPDDIYCDPPFTADTLSTEMYQVYKVEQSACDDNVREYIAQLDQIILQKKTLSVLKTIKKCMVFFTTLTVIGIVCGILLALMMLNG